MAKKVDVCQKTTPPVKSLSEDTIQNASPESVEVTTAIAIISN